mmetsp:Transcript_3555/g.8495  ORF Transcript_3555/g.8495 Transcript_3555/m.8495 type:complete len:257 (+) Transcript_3555:137-907(+)
MIADNLFGSNEREEHVESDLDSVEEEQSVLVGDELEVDKVNKRPDLPRSLAGSEKVVLDLGSNSSETISGDESKVSEEDSHENWAPDGLVDEDLRSDRFSVLSGDLRVEPVVEVVTRRSVVEDTESGKSEESLHVEGTSGDEDLCQQITEGPSNKRGHGLGGQGTLVKSSVVSGPSGNGTSANEGRITEERALGGRALAESRLDDIVGEGSNTLGDGGVGADTEGTCGGSDKKETKKLHDYVLILYYVHKSCVGIL